MDMKSRHMPIEICESLHGLALRDRPLSRISTSRDISRVWGYKIFSAMLLLVSTCHLDALVDQWHWLEGTFAV
eukprot:scaffold33197_cov77-Skeletonema_marinoi.AAC.1